MRQASVTALAQHRAHQKRMREKRLAAAHARVSEHRAAHPLPQKQLELDDEYLSKREHDLRIWRWLQLEAAKDRAARIEAAHARATPPLKNFHVSSGWPGRSLEP